MKAEPRKLLVRFFFFFLIGDRWGKQKKLGENPWVIKYGRQGQFKRKSMKVDGGGLLVWVKVGLF